MYIMRRIVFMLLNDCDSETQYNVEVI